MPCSQTLNSILNDCSSSMGGIVEVYIANHADVDAVTVTDGKVSGITMATSKKFKTFQFARKTGSLTSNYTIDKTTGANFVASDLVLVFNRLETSKRLVVTALAQGELAIIVKDCNGLYWYLGYDLPVTAAGDNNAATGTTPEDRNGYTVTLHDESHELPMEVNIGTGTGQIDISTIVE